MGQARNESRHEASMAERQSYRLEKRAEEFSKLQMRYFGIVLVLMILIGYAICFADATAPRILGAIALGVVYFFIWYK